MASSSPATAGIPLDVEAGKIAEFSRAVGIALAELRDPDGRLIVPPTFLTVLNFVETPEAIAAEFGFELSRMLHGEQEYVFPGSPPAAGDRLVANSSIVRRYEKAGRRGGVMRFAVRTTEFRSAEGTLVAVANTTAIETAAAVDGAG